MNISLNDTSIGLIHGVTNLPPGSPNRWGSCMFPKFSVLVASCLLAILCVQGHAQTPALSPAPGTILSGSSVTFSWTAAGGSSAYALTLGTTGVGSHNLYSSGTLVGSNVTVNNLPTGGQTIYARWSWRVGTTWSSTDYTYTEAGSPVAPVLESPVNTTLSSSAQFNWTTGSGATEYTLLVGTTGVGSRNVFSSGATTATAAAVSNIPQGGQTVYVRLEWLLGSTWQTADYTDTEAGSPVPAAMQLPTPGLSTTLAASTQFTWSAGQGPTEYQLCLGTGGVGSRNLFSSGALTGTTVTVNNIPQDGVTVFARLYWLMGSTWQYADYQYTEGGTPVPPTFQSPIGQTLTGSSATFTWSAGVGPSYYMVYVGDTGLGSRNIYNSGPVTGTSVTANSIPQNGVTIYVRFNWEINGTWQYADYTDTEAGTSSPPVLTTPTPGSTLPSGSTLNLSWQAGVGPTYYRVYVGTTGVGSNNLYISPVSTATSATASNVPQTGATLYVRLFWNIDGAWQHADYTYTEYGTTSPASLTSPASGSTFNSSTETFIWNPGVGSTYFNLDLGTTGAGTTDILDSGVTTATSMTVTDLPIQGETIYARLLWLLNGVWQHADYTFNTVSAQIVSPVPGTTLPGSSATFTWTGTGGITSYVLHLGTTPGSSNLYTSSVTSNNSVTVSSLPTNGAVIYATLDYELSGVWQATTYTYTEASATNAATLISPTQGSTLSNSTQTFTWTSGTGASNYQLTLGTGGPNSTDVYDGPVTTNTSAVVSGIPTGGSSWGTFDAGLECTGEATGTTLSSSVMPNCLISDRYVGFDLSEDPLTPMQVAPSQGGLGGSVIINGTAYPANSSTQSFSYDHTYGQQFFSVDMPYGATSYTLNMNGYLTLGPPPSGATDVVFDYIVALDLNGGQAFEIELHTGTFEGCTYCVFLNANPNWTATYSSSGIPVSQNTRYAFSVQGNEATGTASLALYDPTSFTQIGSTITDSTPSGTVLAHVLVGNSANTTAAGSVSYFEDLLLDASGNTTFPNIPQPAQIFGTLYTEVGGVWESLNYTFTEGSSSGPDLRQRTHTVVK